MSAEEYERFKNASWDDLFNVDYGLMNSGVDVMVVRLDAYLAVHAEQRFEAMLVYPRTPSQTLPLRWLPILLVFACGLLGLRAAKSRYVRAEAVVVPGRSAGRSLYARPPPSVLAF